MELVEVVERVSGLRPIAWAAGQRFTLDRSPAGRLSQIRPSDNLSQIIPDGRVGRDSGRLGCAGAPCRMFPFVLTLVALISL